MKGRLFTLSLSVLIAVNQMGCAGNSKKIATGMLVAAPVGAIVGHQFVHHGPNKQYEAQNTIITAVVFSLAVGGLLAWHYRTLEEQRVEISGRYARYRLCDPDELSISLSQQLDMGAEKTGVCSIHQLQGIQAGDSSVVLDDNIKWLLPTFRKRYLQPDRSEKQVTSKRYIWEIIKPGSFVTRSQNPEYFSETEEIK